MSNLCALKLTLFFLSLRSDWDVRTSPVPEVGPGPLSALSTDCLGLDQTCPGTATITTTLLPPLLSARPDIISDLVHNDDDNNTMIVALAVVIIIPIVIVVVVVVLVIQPLYLSAQ